MPASSPSSFTVYHAAAEFLDELIAELGDVSAVHGHLVFAPGPPRNVAWAQNIWLEPQLVPIDSIKHAAQYLRQVQRNWVCSPMQWHRRCALIQQQLAPIRFRPIEFIQGPARSMLGCWTLLEPNLLCASATTSSVFPNGVPSFVEDRLGPPSRAYLKLWELFTIIDKRPQPGQLCLDLGSCPGGWTWVLQQLGADVTSVDKAALASHVAALPRVRYIERSAFSIDPNEFAPQDWVCSDVIAYPQRLLTMVKKWIDSGRAQHVVCSVKLKGETDLETIKAFAAIPGSRLLHLYNNKHELTFVHGLEDQ